MPWEHCEQELNDDQAECPSCGVGKDTWTTQWGKTRTFRFKRPQTFRLELQVGEEEDELEAAQEPYRVTLPGSEEPAEGRLTDYGTLRLPCPGGGTAVIEFPGRLAAEFDEEDGEDVEPEDGEGPAFVRFEREVGVKQVLHLKPWLDIELVDRAGEPLADARYEVRLAGGDVRDGRLDDRGFARVRELDDAVCEVRFPDLEEPWHREGESAAESAAEDEE